MCTIMMYAGIRANRTERAWKWATHASEFLCAQQRDGFGYAAVGNGQLFGERWFDPEEAFEHRVMLTKAERHMRAQFGDAVDIPEVYNQFGDQSNASAVQAIMLHARFATCEKNLQNVHPFIHTTDDGAPTTALIHNGVISNADKLTKLTSTCDSECILNEYGESGIARFPGNIQDVVDNLRGYYACGVLSHNGEEMVMDVFKSERASLYVGWVQALGTHVFCTTEEILRETAEAADMRVTSVAKVRDGFLIRSSAATGRVLSITEFDEELSWRKCVDKGAWAADEDKGQINLPSAPSPMSLLKSRMR